MRYVIGFLFVLGVLILKVGPVFALELTMIKAPMTEFSEWVSLQTGTNIVLGSDVEGQITFHAPDVPENSVLQFFELVMTAYDFEVIFDSVGVQVVKQVEGKPGKIKKIPLHSVVVPVCNLLAQDLQSKINHLVNGLSRGSVVVLPGNNLLIIAEADVLPIAEKLVVSLDHVKARYLVEAIIFEVNQTDIQELGINFSIGDRLDGIFGAFSGSDLIDLTALPAGLVTQLLKANSFSALVKAIQTYDHAKLLSTPKLLVLDGLSGRISVGQNVPFVTGSSTGDSSDTDNPFQTIERKDVGVSLAVTPLAISSELIQIRIKQEASSVSQDAFASDIITNSRSIDTTVQVVPGQVIQLGGLVSNDDLEIKTSVPVLGKLPYLGNLFRGSRTEERQRELTVFLRVVEV